MAESGHVTALLVRLCTVARVQNNCYGCIIKFDRPDCCSNSHFQAGKYLETKSLGPLVETHLQLWPTTTGGHEVEEAHITTAASGDIEVGRACPLSLMVD